MPNIKPISDLRNYNEALRDVATSEPGFLPKNGRKRYVLVDIQDYEKTQATMTLLSQLVKGEHTGRKDGWISIDGLEAALGIQDV